MPKTPKPLTSWWSWRSLTHWLWREQSICTWQNVRSQFSERRQKEKIEANFHKHSKINSRSEFKKTVNVARQQIHKTRLVGGRILLLNKQELRRVKHMKEHLQKVPHLGKCDLRRKERNETKDYEGKLKIGIFLFIGGQRRATVSDRMMKQGILQWNHENKDSFYEEMMKEWGWT